MKKIFTLFIWLLLLPVTALAATPSRQVLYVGGVQISTTGYWTTDSEGNVAAYSGTGIPTDNYIYYGGDNNTLTLHNATIKEALDYGDNPPNSLISGAAIGVLNQQGNAELTIQLEGSNTIAEVSQGIYVLAHSQSTGSSSLTITGDGSLEASGSSYGIQVQSNGGNATLTIQNADVTAENSSSSGDGVTVRAGSSSSASLSVDGGSLTATGKSEHGAGIRYTFGSSISGSGKPSLTVSNSAIVRANGSAGGITSNSSSPIQYETGSDSTGGIVFDNGTGTVYGNVTLQEDLEIGEGESLTLDSDASLDAGDYDVIVDGGTLDEKLKESLGDKVKYAPAITTTSLSDGEVGTAYSQKLEATGDPTITWSVTSGSLPDGLSLNSDGTITGTPTAEGTSTFTVKAENSVGSDSKELMLTVTAPTTYTITAEASPAEGGTVTVNGGTSSVSVEANSTVNLVATPNAGYRFTGWTSSNGGTFADASSVSTTFTMPANDVIVTAGFEQYYPVTSITLDKSELSLYTGNSETLTATIEPDNATNKNVTWSSDNADVAIVNNGTVKAMGAGDATITVTTEDVGKTATCVVQVRKPATVEASGSTNLSFTTDRDEFTLTATVQVNGDFLNPTENSWKWSVANEDVVERVTLRSKAVSYSTSRQAFTVEGTGTTTITATYDDGTYRGSVDFTVRISKPTPPDPISYYNIYVEDVCDGVEVTTSKNVVREGGSVSVYVKKDTVNYTFDNFKVYYKRSYYGGWEELKEGTQPGEYPIKNIWTHIYIKAEGAEEKEDPTGIESIEGVKVYTKDGSLYVQTPQREQVIIVSMSGAVVKNEEQIGLKQYHGLQSGIYIVRIGDRAYKLRLN